MNIKFEGLDELIREVDKIATDTEVERANSNILKECGKKAQKTVMTKMPKSKNPNRSGRKGSRTGQHSADNVPLSGVSKKNGQQSITVGWEKPDRSPYFYVKFLEWGTPKINPYGFMIKTNKELSKTYSGIAEKEYEELISKLK